MPRIDCKRCKLWATPLAPGALNAPTAKEKSLPQNGIIRLACQTVVSGDCEVRTFAVGPERVKVTTEWVADPRPSKWRDRWDKAKAGGGGGEEEPAAEPEEA